MKIMLCIATDQNLANLIPALQIQPDEAWILATPRMDNQARSLKKLLDRHHIGSRIEPLDDTTVGTLESEAERLAIKLDGPSHHTIFNATGGTKPMAIVLATTLSGLLSDGKFEILYADTEHQRIDWLHPRNRQSKPMGDLLSLDDILSAHGFRLDAASNRKDDWIKTAEERSQLTRDLGDHADKLAGFFGALNWLAQKAIDAAAYPSRQELDYEPGRQAVTILKNAQKHELLDWDGSTVITFPNEAATRYIGGGWLEEYLFFKLRGCRVKDFAINAQLTAADGKTTNEIDAMAVHRNRLLAIECKTLRFGRDTAKDADILYKIDSLSRRTGGLMHERILLSARPLDDASLARARDFKIDVVAGKDIANFPDRIRKWMER